MAKKVIHVSDAEATNDFASVLDRVRAGADFRAQGLERDSHRDGVESDQAVLLESRSAPTCGTGQRTYACPRAGVFCPRGYEPGARPRRASSRRASG